MKTRLSSANPFGPTRYGYLFERLASTAPGRHLDYGCFDGEIILRMSELGVITTGVGVDRNADAVSGRSVGSVELVHLQDPLADFERVVAEGRFGSVSLLDVLEHVADQRSLLQSLRDALVPDGFFVVTVP